MARVSRVIYAKRHAWKTRVGSVIRWSTTSRLRSPIASRLGMQMLWSLWEPGTGLASMA